jgi:hypothetical protein
MEAHVRVLGVLYIAFSALALLGAFIIMVTLGGAAGIVGAAAPPEDAAIALPIIGITGLAVVILLLILGLPGLITGWGLLNYKPWARILGLILAVLNLFNIPIGTALGIYALWVLLNKDTERLFTEVPAHAP